MYNSLLVTFCMPNIPIHNLELFFNQERREFQRSSFSALTEYLQTIERWVFLTLTCYHHWWLKSMKTTIEAIRSTLQLKIKPKMTPCQTELVKWESKHSLHLPCPNMIFQQLFINTWWWLRFKETIAEGKALAHS